jgi:hypothetical protein
MVFNKNILWIPAMRIMTGLTLDEAIFANFSVSGKKRQIRSQSLFSGRDVYRMRIVPEYFFPGNTVFIVAADTEILCSNAIFSDVVSCPQKTLMGPVDEVAATAEP